MDADFGDGFEKAGGVGWVGAVGCYEFDSFGVDAGGVGGGDGDGAGASAGFGDGCGVVVFVIGVVSPSLFCCRCHVV